ncbi:hypothetical protein PRMUPPPA20_03990 [Xylanibacter ruminicola]|uniref:Uncharacterized protein n=1 Tax=Xylanibacter ruminicola TaxID=839 RepID=A0AA37I5S8_XYLRU|nr:hypothetical protein [Xylanibacter ruminicola]GJG32290.1 hypothetical protein PRMUPPPA20_03990 [Xylanibacter ruminicola]
MGLTNRVIMDNNVDVIEREIFLKYNDYRCYNSDNDVLLSLRKGIINKQILANQKELLPDIIAFNDALREALRDMYDRAHRIWDKMINIIDEGDGEEMELTAKIYLDTDYPALHPIQGDDRQDLWYALCDDDLNPMYADGISVLTLTFPRDEGYTFDTFIGMDCPPPNWNEGLDPELTKDLHLISQFHNLFQHMLFAITDFIYVRKFKTEINIEIIQ